VDYYVTMAYLISKVYCSYGISTAM